MRRRSSSLVAAAFLALAASPALAASTALPPPDAVARSTPGITEYRISPADTLDINVSQLPELTKVVEVGQGGKILLPLIGQVQAAGRTPVELSDDIATALKKKYMKDPIVVVAVKEAQGDKITIDGAVTKPGVYPLAGPTTLLQAVALAQGHRKAHRAEVRGHQVKLAVVVYVRQCHVLRPHADGGVGPLRGPPPQPPGEGRL